MVGPVERYFVVPHTHWDREWYGPFEHFRLMLGGVVDEVLDTLERDPEFRSFTLDGQAIVLEDYVAMRPENESRLRALIAAGRIEIGPSYVLPDEFLVSGEALVRNLLIGRAVCSRFGGQPSVAGYLPDSFGHPLQLPQILAGFGIESLLFSRGLGDEVDDLGLAFRWVAPDGSAVRALQLLADYSNFANISGADDAEARVRALLERFGQGLERADVHEVALCNGTDHWPIQPEMPALCAELERRFPGSAFAIAGYSDYVSALRTGALASWSGELLGSRLWNVLRGVNSARLYIKQANERAEQRLLSVETLAALCALRTGGRFPFEDFTFAWRELLKCHPHNSICGCSCDEVHRDMLVRYASLDRTLDILSSNALSEFAGRHSQGRIGLVNPLPFARRGVLRLEGAGPMLVGLAGFEARTVELAPAAATAPRDGDRIESDRFSVQVARDGTLAVEDLNSGRRFDGLHALEDELDMGDLYNFCPLPGGGVWRCSDASTRILCEGPLCWELEVSYHGELLAGLDDELRPRSETVALSLTTLVRLVRGSDRIEFETTIDNAAKDHRLRAVFPVGHAPGPVRAEGQFARRRPVRGRTAPGRGARAPNELVRAAGRDAACERSGRAWSRCADNPWPARIRGARRRRRLRAVSDTAALRRLDFARIGGDGDAPARGRTPAGDARGAVPRTTSARIRSAVRRGRARQRRDAACIPGLPQPVLGRPRGGAVRAAARGRRRGRVLLPEGRRGPRSASHARVQPDIGGENRAGARPGDSRAGAAR
jgi:hypothetical protein